MAVIIYDGGLKLIQQRVREELAMAEEQKEFQTDATTGVKVIGGHKNPEPGDNVKIVGGHKTPEEVTIIDKTPPKQ